MSQPELEHAQWRKSIVSQQNGGCVEVAALDHVKAPIDTPLEPQN